MIRTQPLVFLSSVVFGAALMSLFQRVRLARLRRQNAALKVVIERKRAGAKRPACQTRRRIILSQGRR